MNNTTFEKILAERLDRIQATLASKAKEYAIGDRLYNFKRAGEILRTTPEKALLGMAIKHIVSVVDIVEGSVFPSDEVINEKVGDAINYFILLEAVLKDRPINTKCVDCGECSNGKIN
jgi:hypothetical protein